MAAKTVSEFIDGLRVNLPENEGTVMQVRVQYHRSDVEKSLSDSYVAGGRKERYSGPEIVSSFYPMAELSLAFAQIIHELEREEGVPIVYTNIIFSAQPN